MNQTSPGTLRRHSRSVVFGVIAAQVLMGLAIAIALFFLAGWHSTYSALVGTLIGALPSYYLGRRLFPEKDTASLDEVVKRIYVAEMMKLGLTVALFVIAIVALNVEFKILIGVYFAVIAVNWLAMRYVDLGERPESSA